MRLRHIFRDTGGATAIEYALIATLISLVAMAGMSVLGGSFANMIGDAARGVEQATHRTP